MSNQILSTTSPQPVMPAERIFALDVLRGAAILGVLIAYTVWNLGGPSVETYSPSDKLLHFLIATFIETKAYTLLAFLFGLGFSMQLVRAKQRNQDVVPVYIRRLLALMAIGITHSLLLRNGDILVPYAVLGFVLLPFRNASDRVLFIGIAVGAVFQHIALWMWAVSGLPFPTLPDTSGMGYLASNLAWAKYWYATAVTNWPGSLPMFLAGLYFGRRRIFENIAAHRRGLRTVLIFGLCVGVGIYVARFAIIEFMQATNGPASIVTLFVRLLWSVHAWGLAAFYAMSLLLFLQCRRIQKLFLPIAALGRMALTNYLLQSIIVVPVCIVFELFDTLTPSRGLLLAAAIASIQVPFSVWWLRRFRFGPAEWLWRSLAYGKAQPMRTGAGFTERNSGDTGSRVTMASC